MITEKEFDFSKKHKSNKLNNFLLNCLIYGLGISIPTISYIFLNDKNTTEVKAAIPVEKSRDLNFDNLERLSYVSSYIDKLDKYNNSLLNNKKDEVLRTEIIGGFSYFFTNDNLKQISASHIISSLPTSGYAQIYEKDRELFNILYSMYQENPPSSTIANLEPQCKKDKYCLNNFQWYEGIRISDKKIMEEKELLDRATTQFVITKYNVEHINEYQKWSKIVKKHIENNNVTAIELSPGEKMYKELKGSK